MPYGTIKIDTVTFTDAGVDKSVTLSGLVQNPTFSGNVTVTGTLSGVTVTGTTANFTSGNFTNISGGTHTITSGVFAAGSAASPSITFTGDLNTGIYSPGADQVAISTNGTRRLIITSDGKVGLGSASVLQQGSAIDGGSGAGILELYNGATGNTTLENTGAFPIIFKTNGSERMRLDSSGRLGLGTSSPGFKLTIEDATTPRIRIGDGTRHLNVDGGSTTQNAAIGTDYAGSFGIYTNGAANTRLHVTSAGNVGIGVTDIPSDTNLAVLGNFQSGFYRNVTSGGRGYFINIGAKTSTGFADGAYIFGAVESGDSTGYLTFGTRTSGSVTEKARVDSSGRLLVGTSTGTSVFDGITPQFQIEGTGYNSSSASLFANSNDANGAYFMIGKSRGTSAGSSTIVNSGDTIGGIDWVAADGTDRNTPLASIYAFVDGTPGANDMPGRLVFSTTADGASSPTERLYLYSNGNVRAPGVYNLTTAVAADVRVDADGYLYRSTSSIRYKTDIETLEDSYADAVLEIRPVWFRSLSEKDNPQWGHWGFIAEEVEQIDPRLCTYSTDENDNLQVESVQYDRFVPHLLNLIKRQKKQIEAMEARLTAAGL